MAAPRMTVAGILKRVEDIRKRAAPPSLDDESAHGHEDDLHKDVLRAIANGASSPSLLARAALETSKIKFPRHCG